MALFSIWEGEAISLIRGLGPPTNPDGERCDPSDVLVKSFQAASWDEASQIRNDHYGWGKYVPLEDGWEEIGPDEP